MRLFKLEVRRIIKSRRNIILLMIAFLMSLVMAYMPISFESINKLGTNGEVIELDGLSAIQYKKQYFEKEAGKITPIKMSDALRIYQKYYGESDEADIPLNVYMDNILGTYPMIMRLSEAYSDFQIGNGKGLLGLDPNEVEQHFYEQCSSHLGYIMDLEQKQYPEAKEYALKKYARSNGNFYYHYGISRDAFDFNIFYILILSIICIAIAATIFSNEYQTGSDNILRCTKHGRRKLAITRILAACFVFTVVFVVNTTIHVAIIDLAFGRECLKSSMQMLFSVVCLPNMNLGQLQLAIVTEGFMSVMAMVSFTLYLSAKCKENITPLLIAMVVLVLPLFSYSTLGANLISTVFPSAGLGLQNSFLYQLADFEFLHLGGTSIWTPYIIVISAFIEIPLFLYLAVRSYCKHQI